MKQLRYRPACRLLTLLAIISLTSACVSAKTIQKFKKLVEQTRGEVVHMVVKCTPEEVQCLLDGREELLDLKDKLEALENSPDEAVFNSLKEEVEHAAPDLAESIKDLTLDDIEEAQAMVDEYLSLADCDDLEDDPICED